MFTANVIASDKHIDFDVPPVGLNSFVFKIDKDCTTSAGIYSANKHLIRTLWSGKKYSQGTYTEQWDGKDDNDNLVPGGNYQVTIVSNNMQYEWEGVVGNTSDSFTGNTIYNNNYLMNSLVVAGKTAYFACGYNERKPSQQKFYVNDIQKKFFVSAEPGQSSYFVATDEETVFWAGGDITQQWFVFGTKVSDDSDVIFEKGQQLQAKAGRKYNAIDVTNGLPSQISGLAVQKRGKFLFVSRENQNQVHVLDKNTGELAQRVTLDQPSLLAIDSQDNIWIYYSGNRIGKFTVQNNGLLTAQSTELNSLPDVQALTISQSKDFLLVASSTDQQLKAYHTGTGKLLWTFGQNGGYTITSEVSDDRFSFTDRKTLGKSCIYIAPDESIWVCDAGTYRLFHFDANRKFIDRIMFIPTSYSCVADANNSERVCSGYLEFKIDYSKPLAPENQSWQLVKNWGGMVPKDWDNPYLRFKCLTTLSNKRTYTQCYNGKLAGWQLVELGQDNRLRFTGIMLSQFTQLYPDGSLRSISKPKTGQSTTFSVRNLSGFDSLGNPTWKPEEIFAVSPVNSVEQPLFRGNLTSMKTGEITDSGVLVSFDQTTTNTGWHLGGITEGSKDWQWLSAKSTTKKYTGDFPANGDFDIGNGVRNAGSVAIVSGNHIFWGYHGEFWKASQTNKWNHVYHNGLFLNQFGKIFSELKERYGAEMAGNAVSASVVTAANGETYLYHNDENYHGGVHRWHIHGFDTIREQTVSLSVSHIDSGISAIYFKNPDLDDLGIQSVVVDKTIDFPSLPLGSVRWNGFIKPDNSGDYTFYIATNGKLCFWINDSLIIDKWNNNAENSFEATYSLTKEVLQKMTIELAEARHVSFYWSSSQTAKTIVPVNNLAPADNPYQPNKYNLLDGLPMGKPSIFENNLYGWQRIPAEEDYTERMRNWWSVQTGVKEYRKNVSADLQITFKKSNAQATISRSLKLGHPVNSWTLSGVFDFTGNQPNRSKDDYMFFDIVDTDNKIIARFFFDGPYPDAILYFNQQPVVHDDYKAMLKLFSQKVSVSIKMTGGKLEFTAEGYKAVVDNVFDKEANWHNPELFRISFGAGGKGFAKGCNISSLFYTVG